LAIWYLFLIGESIFWQIHPNHVNMDGAQVESPLWHPEIHVWALMLVESTPLDWTASSTVVHMFSAARLSSIQKIVAPVVRGE